MIMHNKHTVCYMLKSLYAFWKLLESWDGELLHLLELCYQPNVLTCTPVWVKGLNVV